ncbi:MAG TPA: RNA polymerase sigma factor [Candidatus Aminicenantes bacterium]|nr:RNA polymerase sigma factor [Candidatus Aminicenantes bacterium]
MTDLISELKARDRKALVRVMDLFKVKIYNYLRVLVKDPELAEELTQDTFVKVYFKAHTLRTDNLKAWIYTIATNLARNEFRRQRIRHWLSLEEVSEGTAAVIPTVEDEITLAGLLSRLPGKYRIPLVMKELDNFSFKEIAAMTNKPVGTVKTLVFRAKQRLRTMLQEDGITRETALPRNGLAGALMNGGME